MPSRPLQSKTVAIFEIPPRRPRPMSVIHVRPSPSDRRRGTLTCGPLVLPCALGRAGTTRFKREGDGATPVGRFALVAGWARLDRGLPSPAPIVWRPARADDGWCDDPSDGRYNRPVRLPFAPSHETLRRDDGLYDLVIVLDANLRRRVIGRGSAIFFHCARPDLGPTAGCIALRQADLRRLLPRLARDAVLVVH